MLHTVIPSSRDTIELSDEEAQALVLALLRGQQSPVREGDLQHQYEIVEAWIRRVALDAAAIELVLKGSVGLSVTGAGEIRLIRPRHRGYASRQDFSRARRPLPSKRTRK